MDNQLCQCEHCRHTVYTIAFGVTNTGFRLVDGRSAIRTDMNRAKLTKEDLKRWCRLESRRLMGLIGERYRPLQSRVVQRHTWPWSKPRYHVSVRRTCERLPRQAWLAKQKQGS